MRSVTLVVLAFVAACVPESREVVEPASIEIALRLDGSCGTALAPVADERGAVTGHSRAEADGCHVFVAWEGSLLSSEDLRAAITSGAPAADDDVTLTALEATFVGADLVDGGRLAPFPAPATVAVVVRIDGTPIDYVRHPDFLDAYPLIEAVAEGVVDGLDAGAGGPVIGLERQGYQDVAGWATLVYREHVDLLGEAELEIVIPTDDLPAFTGYSGALELGVELAMSAEVR